LYGCDWPPLPPPGREAGAELGPAAGEDGRMGLPQSIQYRDSESLSRPQKAHVVRVRPPTGEQAWGANIGRVTERVNETDAGLMPAKSRSWNVVGVPIPSR